MTARTHGQTRTLLYKVWDSMVQRCTNTNDRGYHKYGGRGISVCARWRKFENFYADMGPRPSALHQIERVDNDGNYEPDNCEWVTAAQQAANRRNTRRVTLADGTVVSLKAYAAHIGMNYKKLYSRVVRLGCSPEEAATAERVPYVRQFIEYNGVRLSAAAWSRKTGLTSKTIIYRLRRGWTVEQALSEPAQIKAGSK